MSSSGHSNDYGMGGGYNFSNTTSNNNMNFNNQNMGSTGYTSSNANMNFGSSNDMYGMGGSYLGSVDDDPFAVI